nr:hypothetical protein GCM10017745_28740 [Saccharothrix mutabilis subsp. capreolus]
MHAAVEVGPHREPDPVPPDPRHHGHPPAAHADPVPGHQRDLAVAPSDTRHHPDPAAHPRVPGTVGPPCENRTGAGGHPSGTADVAGAAATTPPTANATAHNRLDLRLMHTPQ